MFGNGVWTFFHKNSTKYHRLSIQYVSLMVLIMCYVVAVGMMNLEAVGWQSAEMVVQIDHTKIMGFDWS